MRYFFAKGGSSGCADAVGKSTRSQARRYKTAKQKFREQISPMTVTAHTENAFK